MSIDELIAHFERYIPLSGGEKEALLHHVTERKIRRRQAILQEGDVCRYYTFVVSGCFKMYSVDETGAAHNIQFAAEGDWIMDISSFHSGKGSPLYIEAMEPSIVLQIDKPTLIYLYQHHEKFSRIFRVIIENKYIALQDRMLQSLSNNAEHRYLAFLDQYPQLSNRLPNTQIASYLGITPEFLSVIRKGLATKRHSS